jgi:hypothetical protein
LAHAVFSFEGVANSGQLVQLVSADGLDRLETGEIQRPRCGLVPGGDVGHEGLGYRNLFGRFGRWVEPGDSVGPVDEEQALRRVNCPHVDNRDAERLKSPENLRFAIDR